MLTEAELATLESLLVRARAAAGQARSQSGETVNVGDLVQLRPGADSHWQTSLLLVCKIRDDGRISGVVLRPHRSGSRDAWYTYSVPEVLRIGRAPFPPPESTVSSASFLAQCPRCLGRDGSDPPPSLAAGQQDGGEIATRRVPLWPKAKPKTATVRKAEDMVAAIESIAGDLWKWKSHLPEICVGLDEKRVPHPPKWPSWTGQLTAAANLVILNIAHHIEVYEDQQGAAVPLPKPKPIQRETCSHADDQQDGGEIQIGPRLWWVPIEEQQELPEPKPIQRETGETVALQIGPQLWAMPA